MAASMCPPDLILLQEKIASCDLCPLSLSRNLTVPGSGPSKAEIMLVGEAAPNTELLIDNGPNRCITAAAVFDHKTP